MKKLNPLEIHSPDYIENKKLDYVYSVKNNELTKSFIDKENINDVTILRYLSKFLRVIEQNQDCLNCKSVKNCPKASKGLQLNLYRNENEIDFKFSPCSKFQDLYQLNYSYIYRSFNEDFLLHDFKDLNKNEDYISSRGPIIAELIKILKNNLTKGVYLYGDHGVGKSFIMALFSKQYSIIDKDRKIAFIDGSSEFQDLLDLYFRDKTDFNNSLKKINNADLLIIDNFGDEYKNELIRDSILFPILSERYRNKKLTCFISNYHMSEIKSMYSLKEYNSPKARQLCELIEKLAKTVELKGIAYRE